MCIAVSWPASRVAKLACFFELASVYYSSSLMVSASMPVGIPLAMGTAIFAATVLLPRNSLVARRLAAGLCVIAACGHAACSLIIEVYQRRWKSHLLSACQVGIDHVTPELEALIQESVTGLGIKEVINQTVSSIIRHESVLAGVADAGLRPHTRVARGITVCTVPLSRAVFGSLTSLAIATHVLGAVLLLLELLVLGKVFMDDTPAGRRLSLRLLDEVRNEFNRGTPRICSKQYVFLSCSP
mmetsp:Transcript_38505/g.87493  ORF Transcript_38505/g.87493 Transcript_38505/m.87493 type:complete len:242 (-) Transcript_38505:227-952(-)